MSKRNLNAPLGASLIVLSSLFYASYGIWTTLLGTAFNGYTASAIRSVLVLFLFLPIAAAYHKFEPLRLRKNWHYIAGMFVGSLINWGPLYYAILHAGVGVSLAVSYACIVIGMFLFGWMFAGEHFTRDKAISAILGIAGLALIFSPNISSLGLLALGAAAVSGLSSAWNSVFAKKISYNATQSTITLWGVSLAANGIMAVFFTKAFPVINGHSALVLVVFAIASICASWSFVRGVKLVDAGAAGILGLLEIVFGILFGVLIFNEKPAAIELIGASIIILAAAIPYVKDFNLKRGTLK